MSTKFYITENATKQIFEVLRNCPYITSIDTILKRAGITTDEKNYEIYKEFIHNSKEYKLNKIKASRIIVYCEGNSLYGKFSSVIYDLGISLDELYKAIDVELDTKTERNVLFVIKNAVYSLTGLENILTDLNKWRRVRIYIKQNSLYYKDFSKPTSYVLFSGNSIWQIEGESKKRICFETIIKTIDDIVSKHDIKSPNYIIKKALSGQKIVLDNKENLMYNKLLTHVNKLLEKKEVPPVIEFYFGELQLRCGNIYTPLLIPEEIISGKIMELLSMTKNKGRHKILKSALKEITGLTLISSDGDPLYERYLSLVSSKKITDDDTRKYKKFESKKLKEEKRKTYYHVDTKKSKKKNCTKFPFDSHVTQLSAYKMS